MNDIVITGVLPLSRALLQWSQCSVAASRWHGMWHVRCPTMSTVRPTWRSWLPASQPSALLPRCSWWSFCSEPSTRLFLYLHSRCLAEL